MKKFLYSFVLTTFALLIAVMLVQWCKQLLANGKMTINAHYSNNIMIAGLVADTFRGLMLAILYPKITKYDSSYKKALSFGLIISFIAGSLATLYPLIAGETSGLPFLIEELIILLLQGVLSGLALGFIYIQLYK